MEKRLRITLPTGWADRSKDHPDWPPTVSRQDDAHLANILQFSTAWWNGGNKPNVTVEALIELASKVFARAEGFELLRTSSGKCAIGIYGTAVAKCRQFPHLQQWHVSNGCDFAFINHICALSPSAEEIADAQTIVETLKITNGEQADFRIARPSSL